MLTWKSNRSAFTLIELLVVVIIVAVLAAVGVPMLSANIQRARTSEADAGLGTIRTALRAYFSENQTFIGATFANIGLGVDGVGNNNGDLDGRFFDDNDYSLTGLPLAAATFCARVTGGGAGATEAPRADQVNAVSRSINQNGDIFANAACTAPRVN